VTTEPVAHTVDLVPEFNITIGYVSKIYNAKGLNDKAASRSLKTMLNMCSQFSKTLYLDCDTLVVKPIDDIWNYLQDATFSFRKDRTPTVERCDHAYPDERNYTVELLGRDAVQYNGGIFMWHAGHAADYLFNRWHEEWTKFKHIDQLSLARAVASVKPTVCEYPDVYNHMVADGDQTWDQTDACIGHFIWDRKPGMDGFYACVQRLFPSALRTRDAITEKMYCSQ